MATITYLVTVEVPDGSIVVEGGDYPDLRDHYQFESDYDGEDEATKFLFSAKARALIVMNERLGCDDDYGFEYTLDWEPVKSRREPDEAEAPLLGDVPSLGRRSTPPWATVEDVQESYPYAGGAISG